MKKFITLAALAMFAATAQSASLTWGYGFGYLYLADEGASTSVQARDYTGTVSGDAAFVLVYLGSSSTMDVSQISASDVVASIAYGTSFDGDDNYADPTDASFKVESGTYNVGDYFGIAFFDGEKYSAIYSVTDYDTGAIGAALTPVVQITDLEPTTSYELYGSDGGPVDDYDIHMAGVYASSSSTPVIPEPGIACMALLGIGMMIKRRKA